MTQIKLPNIRKIFIPDPGYVICDCDLSGADAQVVAWESNDDDLKRAFRTGLDIHNHNGKSVWGDNYNPTSKIRKYTMRDELKRAVHGTNYGASSRTLATTLSWTLNQANDFQSQWFKLHPAIKNWHKRVEYNLFTKRITTNTFGYRIIWFDRPQTCFTKALAWGPQSTVGIVCSLGGIALSKIPWLHVLLQVHDSLVFQIPFNKLSPSGLKEIKDSLTIPVPYPDPLYIPWGLAISEKSWGDVKKTPWPEAEI